VVAAKRLLARARAVAPVVALVAMPWLAGCGGHSARTLEMRTALDAGNAKAAIHALDEELDVKDPKDLPADIKGDNAILVLDRASIQQGAGEFPLSKRDFEAADKSIDMLDLARNAADSIGEYVFSGSVGRYQAPPYEKLMINTLNMLNYLETKDLNGARIEARRLSVIQKYYRESLEQKNNPVLGLGSMLAGFTYEKSGEVDEALRYYDESLAFTGFGTLGESVRRIAPQGSFRSPRIRSLLSEGEKEAPGAGAANDDTGEVLFVVGYGRVAHKIPNRIPIGLALTYFASSIQPNDAAAANKLAAQGLVTWINFPSLAPGRGKWDIPSCNLDGQYVQLEEAVDVDHEVRTEWKKIEGKIIVSAITRLIARAALGQGIQTAAGRDNIIGILASLGTQATLTALDTPDTRSWETLPARVAVARVRLPPGRHSVVIDARGWKRTQELVVEKNSWQVVSLMALR
jgi:tetratricopeptide (TPR) repeat protein